MKRKTYKGHLKYWTIKTEEINVIIDENDKTHNINWFKAYTINIHSLTNQSLPLQSQINVYTDGSKTNHHTGSGFAIYRRNQLITTGSRRLPLESTVFQAEILAIRLAMIRLNEILQTQDQYIKFFTDSQASIQALNSHEIKMLAVKDTIPALNPVGQKVNRLEINWIKAHVGHPGNEMADKLAIETINQKENIHGIFPPYSHFKTELWSAMYKLWAVEWQNPSNMPLIYKLPTKTGKE